MGRRSYLDHDGLLPNSTNIIVSTNPSLALEDDALLAQDLPQAIELAKTIASTYFVIGGASLIDEAIPLADAVYESIVEASIEGDTFLTPYDFDKWHSELLFEQVRDTHHAHNFQAFLHRRPQA